LGLMVLSRNRTIRERFRGSFQVESG